MRTHAILPILVLAAVCGLNHCKAAEPKETVAVKQAEKPVKKGPSYLGIVYLPTQRGAQVVDVMPESPAYRAGINAGDLILKANGTALRGVDALKRQIFSQPPGTEIELLIVRAHREPMTVTAVLEPWDGRMPLEMQVVP